METIKKAIESDEEIHKLILDLKPEYDALVESSKKLMNSTTRNSYGYWMGIIAQVGKPVVLALRGYAALVGDREVFQGMTDALKVS